MKRDCGCLRDSRFDLLVLGGDVHAAWAAYDATLRGLRVALISPHDWSPAFPTGPIPPLPLDGTEGGADSDRLEALVEEHERMWRLGPHRYRLHHFVQPRYRNDGLSVSDVNRVMKRLRQIDASGALCGRYRRIDSMTMQRSYHYLKAEGLEEGIGFSHCVFDAMRLILELIDGAVRAGAVVANHVPIRTPLEESGAICGVRALDRETYEPLDVRATLTVVCGPMAATSEPRSWRAAPASGLLIDALPTDDAWVGRDSDGTGVLCLIPWNGRCVAAHVPQGRSVASAERLREEIATIMPRIDVPQDAIYWDTGMAKPVADASKPDWRERPGLLIAPAEDAGLARLDAERLVDRSGQILERELLPSTTASRRLPWRPAGSYREWRVTSVARALAAGIDEQTAELQRQRYGARSIRLVELVTDAPELARRIVDEAPYCLAEVVHVCRFEMALGLADVLDRRLPVPLLARLDAPSLRRIAALVGRELGWTPARTEQELASYA